MFDVASFQGPHQAAIMLFVVVLESVSAGGGLAYCDFLK